MAESAPDALAGTTVGRVSLRVADLDRIVDFYETVVGLETLSYGDDRAVLGAGNEPLLVLQTEAGAEKRTRAETGLFHTAFRLPSRQALAAALERVQQHGTLTGASDHLVSEALYLRDPEDNGVEIYWDRPRAEWSHDEESGRVEMETLALDLDDLRAANGAGDADGDDTDDADGDAGRVAGRRAPDGTTIGHVHLEVSSLPRAQEFYVDGLGLRVRSAYDDEALFLAADDYHHHVGLNTWNARSEPPTGLGLGWYELLVPDEATLAAVRERLVDAGISATEAADHLDLTDPDGIQLRIRVAD